MQFGDKPGIVKAPPKQEKNLSFRTKSSLKLSYQNSSPQKIPLNEFLDNWLYVASIYLVNKTVYGFL